MTEAATPEWADAWPQAVVLASSCVAFLWSARGLVRRRRLGDLVVASRPTEPVPWEAADVAIVVVFYLLGGALLTQLSGESRPLVAKLVNNATLSLGTMLAAVAWLRFRGASWADLGFRFRSLDVVTALRGLALVVFPLLMLAAALNAIVRYQHPVVDFLDARRDVAAGVLVVLTAVVVAPLTEEFFFRRVLQGWLQKHFVDEPVAAVWIASIAFAVAHVGQGLAYIPLFVLAMLLGLIAERTGSIVPCVLLHGMFNAVSVFLLLAQQGGAASPG